MIFLTILTLVTDDTFDAGPVPQLLNAARLPRCRTRGVLVEEVPAGLLLQRIELCDETDVKLGCCLPSSDLIVAPGMLRIVECLP